MDRRIYLKGFLLDEKGNLKEINHIETPLILVENIQDFKINTFWLKIKDIWVLLGKTPPLKLSNGDLVILKEDNKKWGMFIFLDDLGDYIILQDAKGERKTKVKKEILKKLKLFGKVLRVQNKL